MTLEWVILCWFSILIHDSLLVVLSSVLRLLVWQTQRLYCVPNCILVGSTRQLRVNCVKRDSTLYNRELLLWELCILLDRVIAKAVNAFLVLKEHLDIKLSNIILIRRVLALAQHSTVLLMLQRGQLQCPLTYMHMFNMWCYRKDSCKHNVSSLSLFPPCTWTNNSTPQLQLTRMAWLHV